MDAKTVESYWQELLPKLRALHEQRRLLPRELWYFPSLDEDDERAALAAMFLAANPAGYAVWVEIDPARKKVVLCFNRDQALEVFTAEVDHARALLSERPARDRPNGEV